MCGIIGVVSPAGDAAALAHAGIVALQHRGRESWGVAAVAHAGAPAILRHGLGAISDQAPIAPTRTRLALAHTRYSTTGPATLSNSQPFVRTTALGELALAHNGNITNAQAVAARLRAAGYEIQSTSDSELILGLIAIAGTTDPVEAVRRACEQLEGAYSVVATVRDRLLAFRDPRGFRPLALGTSPSGASIAASETCALDGLACTQQRELEPGELVVADGDGVHAVRLAPSGPRTFCVFEHVYLARPDTRFGGVPVAAARVRSGLELAREAPADGDVVVPIPASGVLAATGYARESGIPMLVALVRNERAGRTFIEPDPAARQALLRLKFDVLPGLDGKRVVLVDDSIVRGTTMSHVVGLVRAAGATEIHIRIASPPLVGPCRYGIDIASARELVAVDRDLEGVRKRLGATSLRYLSLAGLRTAVAGEADVGICTACLASDSRTDSHVAHHPQSRPGRSSTPWPKVGSARMPSIRLIPTRSGTTDGGGST